MAGVTPGGALAYGLATALIAEVGVTCWDFVTEDATRLRYPATKRVLTLTLTLTLTLALTLNPNR